MHFQKSESMSTKFRMRFNSDARLLFKLIFVVTTVIVFTTYYLFSNKDDTLLVESIEPRSRPEGDIETRSAVWFDMPIRNYSNPCTGYSPRRCIKRFDNQAAGILTSIMTSECNGRLGNQMFSYAYLYAFATFNQRQAYMSAVNSNLISKYFKVSLDTMDFNLSSSIEWNFYGYAPGNFKALPTTTNHKFCHNPQVRRHFDDIRPQIQREFQFHDDIQETAEMQLAKAHFALTGHENQVMYGIFRTQFVGIHVRRSDYMSISFPATAQFYYSAMMYFQSKYANTIFIVASEDLGWCKENFEPFTKDGLRIYYLEGVSEDDGGLDMAVLVNCDHLIFGVGSFGFWAGYLNSGEVVYCSDCINNGTVWRTNPSIYEGSYANFVKPSWKGMSNDGNTTILV